jgi:hypothetical protein
MGIQARKTMYRISSKGSINMITSWCEMRHAAIDD